MIWHLLLVIGLIVALLTPIALGLASDHRSERQPTEEPT